MALMTYLFNTVGSIFCGKLPPIYPIFHLLSIPFSFSPQSDCDGITKSEYAMIQLIRTLASGAHRPSGTIDLSPLDELRQRRRNATDYGANQILKIAASIREFGWPVPNLGVQGRCKLNVTGHAPITTTRLICNEGNASKCAQRAKPQKVQLLNTTKPTRRFVLNDDISGVVLNAIK